MKTQLYAIISGFVGAVLAMSLFQGMKANADDPELPRVVPYDGTIELDGEPRSEPVDMRFKIYTSVGGDDAVWTEVYSTDGDSLAPVDVYNGRFSVLLG